MRLDKFLANMGYGSRKDVKGLVKKKHVTVNGKLIKKADIKIDPFQDVVFCMGEQVEYKEYIYIMLHKPQGVISATEDTSQKTVIDLLKGKDKILNPFPVGRLDIDTEGLLLLTNDGQLAHELLSPQKEVNKTYIVEVQKNQTSENVQKVLDGVTLEDGYQAKPAKLQILDERQAKITITEGKFHQVKRMFKAVGNKVIYLKRLSMGSLQLDEQGKKGNYRELTEDE